MTRGSRILWLAIRIAVAAFVTLLFVAATFEVYLRQAGFLEAQPANYPCVAGDPVLNHVFHKSCEGVAGAKALKTAKDVTYRTNSLGYRGPEPLPGKRSLVVLGDSYTEGFGLEESETFPVQLEKSLSNRGLKGWQVLNGGTLGYTPALYTKYFDRYFLELKPQIVLLNLDFTDFNDDPYYLQIAEYDAAGKPVAFPGREIFPAWSLGYVYSNRSALLRFMHQEANQWSLVKRREEIQPRMDMLVSGPSLISMPELEAAEMVGCAKTAEVLARHILELKRRVEMGGGKLLIHMYPPGYLVKSYPAQPQNISFVRTWDQKQRKDYTWACGANPKAVKLMRTFSERNAIPFFDSFPFVMTHPSKEALYFDHDAHWNDRGVAEVTADLAKKLFPILRK